MFAEVDTLPMGRTIYTAMRARRIYASSGATLWPRRAPRARATREVRLVMCDSRD